jgi:hypothetical protein
LKDYTLECDLREIRGSHNEHRQIILGFFFFHGRSVLPVIALFHYSERKQKEIYLKGHLLMDINLEKLARLILIRKDKIEKIVAGSGYLPKTVIGVGTFLLDNDGDLDLLTAKQQVTFEKFIKPLL